VSPVRYELGFYILEDAILHCFLVSLESRTMHRLQKYTNSQCPVAFSVQRLPNHVMLVCSGPVQLGADDAASRGVVAVSMLQLPSETY
jgi:hypothetical protein